MRDDRLIQPSLHFGAATQKVYYFTAIFFFSATDGTCFLGISTVNTPLHCLASIASVLTFSGKMRVC